MNKYKIITDSCIDLNKEEVERYDLTVLPLTIKIADISFEDSVTESVMSKKDFYNHLRNKESSHTSAVTPGIIMDCEKKYLEEGYDILCLCFSSALSGTYNSFMIASEELKAQYPHNKIIVIDTLCASSGQGLLVTNAASLKEEGHDIDYVAKWVEDNKLRLCHLFTVPDLSQLRRGGRLSAPAAAFGTLFNIKPVLHVSTEGKLVPIKKVRGRNASFNYMIDRVVNTIEDPGNQTIFICHGDCLDEAMILGDALKAKLPIQGVKYFYVGPVIGSHSGVGTISIFYFGNDRFNTKY